MPRPKVDEKTRERPQHKEGYQDYVKGHVDDDCPYDIKTPERMSWLCGYYDARRLQKFGGLFPDELEKYEQMFIESD